LQRRLLSSTLLPYTTLFRSEGDPRPLPPLHRGRGQDGADQRRRVLALPAAAPQRQGDRRGDGFAALHRRRRGGEPAARAEGGDRSEEHTSELQSRENLVCRL